MNSRIIRIPRVWPVLIAALALLPMTALAADVGDGTISGESKSPIETWQGLVALVIPLIVAFIIQKGWSKGAQTATMVVVSFIVAVVGQYLTDGWDGFQSADPMLTFLKVVTLTQAAYSTLYTAVPLPQWVEGKTGGDSFSKTNPHAIRDTTAPSGEVVRQTG